MAKKKTSQKPIIETIEDPPVTSEPASEPQKATADVSQMINVVEGRKSAPAPKGDLLEFLKAVQAVGGIERAREILNVVAKLK